MGNEARRSCLARPVFVRHRRRCLASPGANMLAILSLPDWVLLLIIKLLVRWEDQRALRFSCSRLQRLPFKTLCCDGSLTDGECLTISRHYPGIENLILTGTRYTSHLTQYGDPGVKAIAARCHTLKQIVLQNFGSCLTDSAVEHLFQGNNALQVVCCWNCDVTVKPLDSLNAPQLTKFSWNNGNGKILHPCQADYYEAVATLGNLFVRCPLLEDVWTCVTLCNDDIIQALAANCWQMKKLHIAGSSSKGTVSDVSVMEIAKTCGKLEEIHFEGVFPCLTDVGVAGLAAGCPRLCSFSYNCHDSERCEVTSTAVCSLASLCPLLNSVMFFDCAKIDEHGIYELMAHCTKLRSLGVAGCAVSAECQAAAQRQGIELWEDDDIDTD